MPELGDHSRLSHAMARGIIARAVDKCETLKQAGAFIAVDRSGAPVSAVRMDGCSAAAMPLVRAKAFASAANGEPSATFAARMNKFGPGIFASYQAVLRDHPFPGAGGMLIQDGGRPIGAIATGLRIGPFVKLPGVDPSQLMVDGKPANLEDTIISYALDIPYSAQHGDDMARWIDAYGSAPDSSVAGTAMSPAPPASRQPMLEKAQSIADHTIAIAAGKGVRAAMVVVDAGGDILTMDRMDGAPPMGVDVAAATAVASLNFGMPSDQIARHHVYAGFFDQVMEVAPYRMLALPGGFPLCADGAAFGAIGVHCHDLPLAQQLAQAAGEFAISTYQGEN